LVAVVFDQVESGVEEEAEFEVGQEFLGEGLEGEEGEFLGFPGFEERSFY
jgi:hypothetical protein